MNRNLVGLLVLRFGRGWKVCQEMSSEIWALMGEKNIKLYLQEIWCGSALDTSGSEQGPVVVSCGLGRPRYKVQSWQRRKLKEYGGRKQKYT